MRVHCITAVASLLIVCSAASSSTCGAPLVDTAFARAGSVGYALTANASACCDACGATPLCAAYTWRPVAVTAASRGAPPLGRCFLKTAGTAPAPESGAVSGRLDGAVPSSCAFGSVPCSAGTVAAGACALFASWCDTAAGCKAGDTVCPGGAACVSAGAGWAGCSDLPAYLNVSMDVDARASALVGALSLAEIAPQLSNQGYGSGPPGPPGIPRLAVPPYNWLNEALHGFARGGLATSFPQISVCGQSWNRSSWAALGRIIGAEARAKYAMQRRANGTTGDYTGVTVYAPNLNLGRDARWGRLQEVPSESPLLTGEYALAAVTAGQSPVADGSGARAPALAACCKHAIAYSFEKWDGIARAAQNAIVDGRDMLETYMPAFQTCLREGRGASIMCSYNAVNDVPTCASTFLLTVSFRERYGFDGWVMSDYSAIGDTYGAHHYCGNGSAAADNCTALAMKAGVDQDGGGTEFSTAAARLVADGLLTDADVRRAATRLFRARLALGLLDPPEAAPYVDVAPEDFLDTDAHRAAAYEAAQQGLVLLKNVGGALPVSAAALRRVAVVGPNADVPSTLYGNYQGTPPYLITPYAGLAAALPGVAVVTAPGCATVACPNASGFAAALAAAATADLVVAVFGIDQTVEAEGKDRDDLSLPGMQLPLLQALAEATSSRGARFVLVLMTGGPLDVSWAAAAPTVPSIILAGYGSQSAGPALADALLGVFAPAGKLAVTWHANASTDLPAFPDMGMRPAGGAAGSPGRTFRYSTAAPTYAFGHGLTYSTFAYSGAAATPPPAADACAGAAVRATLTNAGSVASADVVQLYIAWPAADADYPAPQLELVAFERLPVLAPGARAPVAFDLSPRAYSRVNASAAATFAQDFAAGPPGAASGVAFGLPDWRQGASGPIGWDDMFAIAPGAARLWLGSGQPGTGAAGLWLDFPITSPLTNLASCVQSNRLQ